MEHSIIDRHVAVVALAPVQSLRAVYEGIASA